MGKLISPRDIKKGDKITIHREVEVASDLDDDGDFKTPDGLWVEVSQYDCSEAGEYWIELVKRPNPEIPTKKGSVVKLIAPGGGSANWFLRVDRQWYSQESGSKTAEQFADFIEESGLMLEAIA